MLSFFRKRKNLFIHIPKTGGSTFIGLLKDSYNISGAEKSVPSHLTPKVKDVEISHINFDTPLRTFKRPDLFEKEHKASIKKSHHLFMLVRNPVDRLISEFNFQFNILGGKSGNKNAGIIARLPKIPKNIRAYYEYPHTQNYQVKFLLGRQLADPTPVSEDDFNRILDAIRDLPIHCGITDKYDSFLMLFEEKSKKKLNRNIVVRKKTPNKFKQTLSEKTREKIAEANDFDLRLYNFVKNLDYIKNSDPASGFSFAENDTFIP